MGVITESERAKWFAYMDGVADGLNESRNDVNAVLDKIRAEIVELQKDYQEYEWLYDDVLGIIDKYKEEQA